MRKLMGSVVLVLVTVLAPAAYGQQAAKHEFGVDLVIAYSKPDPGDGAVLIATPVDVRVGFVSSGKIMVEPRFTFAFDSKGGIDTTTLQATSAFAFSPGINVLASMGPGGHRSGLYVTGGAAYNIVDLGDISFSNLSVNGGVGTRSASGAGALRLEAFVQYDLENTDKGVPSAFAVGARIGLSLWH